MEQNFEYVTSVIDPTRFIKESIGSSKSRLRCIIEKSKAKKTFNFKLLPKSTRVTIVTDKNNDFSH